MKKFTTARHSRGFTLIELLVVIAIIAILAAILFPVFAKAREKARQTTCASNERQISLGIIQYVQDYDETFPIALTIVNGSGLQWPYAVYPYIKSTQVFSCPDDSGPNDIAASIANPGRGALTNYDRESYGMNVALYKIAQSAVAAEAGIYTSINISQFNSPSETCMLAEDNLGKIANQGGGYYAAGYGDSNTDGTSDIQALPYVWYSGADTPVISDPPNESSPTSNKINFGGPIARHTGGANVGFSDGHVKWIRYSTLYNLPTGVTDPKKFKLWHPDAPDS